MSLTDKLIPHLIFVAALLPTVLLLAAAAVSLSDPDPSLAVAFPIQAAAPCEACQSAPAE